MITAGIDVGAKTIKCVILKDGEIAGKLLVPAGIDTAKTARELFDSLLSRTSIKEGEVEAICSTGAGRKEATFATRDVTEVTADVKGAFHLYPTARSIIDVGAEEGRSIRCNEKGKIIDFAVNEKCAAGAGAFVEAMSRALEVDIEEFGRLSLKSTKEVPMNAQCAVFAESEVVSLIHSNTPTEDISRAVHDAIASRITSMVRKVGFEKDVVLIGGVAKNPGFVDALFRDLKTEIKVPEDPEYVGALGAALIASEN